VDEQTKIKNINDRLGRLEAKEGKMSKTDMKVIEQQLATIRERLSELEAKQ